MSKIKNLKEADERINLKIKVIKKIDEYPWFVEFYGENDDDIREEWTKLSVYLVEDDTSDAIFKVSSHQVNEFPIGEEILIFNAFSNRELGKKRLTLRFAGLKRNFDIPFQDIGSWKLVNAPPDAIYTP